MTPSDPVVRPAAEVPWEDVQAVFGARGEAAHCWCSRFTHLDRSWWSTPDEVKCDWLRESVVAGGRGLVAYDGDEPVGWVDVGPRPAYPRLPRQRTALAQRGEDPADDGVWLVTCLVVRAGHRRRGLTRVLIDAALGTARAAGARAVEAYPPITTPGVEITWGELHVGSLRTFLAAGFTEVAHPTKRRLVVRLET